MFRLLMRIGLAASLVLSGYEVLPRAVEAVRIFGFRNDPVEMLLYRLSGLDKADYQKEIAAALAKDDAELARSLADLAASRGIEIDGVLLARISDAEEFSLTRSAGQLWDGVVTGQADSPTALCRRRRLGPDRRRRCPRPRAAGHRLSQPGQSHRGAGCDRHRHDGGAELYRAARPWPARSASRR